MGAPCYVRLLLVTSTQKISVSNIKWSLACFTQKIVWLHYTYGSTLLSASYVDLLYFQNLWVSLYLQVSNFECSVCLLRVLEQNQNYTTLMGQLLQVQPIFVCSRYRITRLHYIYGCSTLNAAYVCQLQLQNRWGTLSYRYKVKSNLLFFAAPTESLGCTTLMGAPPYVRLTLIISNKRNTSLHYSYGCATLSRAYVAYLYLLKHWVRPHNWVSTVKCSLCWLPLHRESLG